MLPRRELPGLMAYLIRHSYRPKCKNKSVRKAGLPYTYMVEVMLTRRLPAPLKD